jgi:hypothetical protein
LLTILGYFGGRARFVRLFTVAIAFLPTSWSTGFDAFSGFSEPAMIEDFWSSFANLAFEFWRWNVTAFGAGG